LHARCRQVIGNLNGYETEFAQGRRKFFGRAGTDCKTAPQTCCRQKIPAPPKTTVASPAATRSNLHDDDPRLRAYLISEKRIRLSFPGDANSDWKEARRQLLAERNGGN